MMNSNSNSNSNSEQPAPAARQWQPAGFFGVGVGPGDPELITLRAARYIQQADVISYIANENGDSQARHIARDVLQKKWHDPNAVAEIPVLMPMSEDRRIANQVYDAAAENIQAAVQAGKSVVFLCEGDPLFFGSFAYLLERLQGSVRCEVVPGISSVNAAASVLQLPLTVQKESLAVVSGRHSQEKLEATLRANDSVVIMKAGRSRQRIINALCATGRTHEARYVEYIGRDAQAVENDITRLSAQTGPYFSLFVITKLDRHGG